MNKSMKHKHKLAVVMEPGFDNKELLLETLDSYRELYGDSLYINTPRSEHSIVIAYALSYGIDYFTFESRFYKHGRAAVQKRNSFMVYSSDEVLLFRNEDDRYQRMVHFAEHRGMNTRVVMQDASRPNSEYVKLLNKKGVGS